MTRIPEAAECEARNDIPCTVQLRNQGGRDLQPAN